MEWLGFGVFTVIFLFIILLMIRARVINPVKHGGGPKKAVFEPAGEDADITFDEIEFPASPAPENDPDEQPVLDDNINHEIDEGVREVGVDDDSDDGDDVLFPPKTEEKKKSRSPFVGLFSSKDRKQEAVEEPIEEPVEEYADVQIEEPHDFFDESHHQSEETAYENRAL